MSRFTKKETMLLMSIIEDYKNIIENRKTDAATIEKRNNAWKAIAQQYKVTAIKSGIFISRTDAQLKRYWNNLKYGCRKADSVRKQYQLQTGGGPPAEENEDEDINEIVRSIVPTIDLTLENPWDSTAELESKKENMEMYEDNNYYGDFGENNDQISTWSASTSTDSSANNNQPKKRFSTNSVQHTAKKMLTDANIFAKEPLSQLNINALSKKSKYELLNKSKIPSGIEIEQDIRIQKLEKATQQQTELHQERLNAITMEKEYWEEMKKTVILKKSVYMLEIKAMKAQVKYWEEKQN